MTSTGTYAGYDNRPFELGERFTVEYEMASDGSLKGIKGIDRIRDEILKALPPESRGESPPGSSTKELTENYRETWYDEIGQYLGHPAAVGAHWVWLDTIFRPGQNPNFVTVYSATIVLPGRRQSGRPTLRVRTIQSTSPHVFDAILDRPIMEAIGPGAPPFTRETEKYAAYDCLGEKVIDAATMRVFSETKLEWWHVREPFMVSMYGDDMFWTSIEDRSDTRREYRPD